MIAQNGINSWDMTYVSSNSFTAITNSSVVASTITSSEFKFNNSIVNTGTAGTTQETLTYSNSTSLSYTENTYTTEYSKSYVYNLEP